MWVASKLHVVGDESFCEVKEEVVFAFEFVELLEFVFAFGFKIVIELSE